MYGQISLTKLGEIAKKHPALVKEVTFKDGHKEKFEQLASEKPSLNTLQHELFSDEEYAKKEFECHGYKFHPKPFVCNRCGAANYAHFVWVEGNRSIQERCACCDSYITCVKYDPRDKGDKISDPFYTP